MPIRNFVETINEEKRLRDEADREKDRLIAASKYEGLLDWVKSQFPKLWQCHESSPIFTGAAVIRRKEKSSCSGDGSVALIMDGTYLLWSYRASDCQRVAVGKFALGGFLLDEKNWYSTPILGDSFDDERLSALLSKLLYVNT